VTTIIVSTSLTQSPKLTARSITMLAVADDLASWMVFRLTLRLGCMGCMGCMGCNYA